MIGAGASILGRVLGGGKQETTSSVDYVKLVKNAEKAGFNPLTALRNGGAAGFMTTSTPALSAGGVAGEVLGGVGNFLSNFDPMADQKREAEYQLVQAQIGNLNASTAAMTRAIDRPGSFNVPGYTAGTVERRPSGTAGTLSKGGPIEAGKRTVTNPWRGGEVNPYILDAETFTQRYGEGEIAETALLGINLGADLAWNYERWRTEGKPIVKTTKIKERDERTWWDYVPKLGINWR